MNVVGGVESGWSLEFLSSPLIKCYTRWQGFVGGCRMVRPIVGHALARDLSLLVKALGVGSYYSSCSSMCGCKLWKMVVLKISLQQLPLTSCWSEALRIYLLVALS